MVVAHKEQLEELEWRMNKKNICCVPPTSWAPSQAPDLWKLTLKPPCATDGDPEALC